MAADIEKIYQKKSQLEVSKGRFDYVYIVVRLSRVQVCDSNLCNLSLLA